MKKLLIIALAVTVALASAACSDTKNNNQPNNIDKDNDLLITPTEGSYDASSLNELWGGKHQVDGNKLTLAADVDFFNNIFFYKDITIDLAGHNINYDAPGTYDSIEFMFSAFDSNVTFTDSVGGGTINATSIDRIAAIGAFDNSNVTVQNIAINVTTDENAHTNYEYGYGLMASGGTLTVNNVTLYSNVAIAVDEETEDAVTNIAINGGTIGTENSKIGLQLVCTLDNTNTTITVDGAKLQGTDAGIKINGPVKLTISGGSQVSSVEGVSAEDLGSVSESNGWLVYK